MRALLKQVSLALVLAVAAALPARGALAAAPRVQVFLIPNDDGSIISTNRLGGMVEKALKKAGGMKVLDLTRVLGANPPASMATTRKLAGTYLASGKKHFAAVEFDAAAASLEKALALYRKEAAWIDRIPEYPEALSYLAATYVLRGDTQKGKDVYKELLLYDPGFHIDAAKFDPSLMSVVSQVRDQIKNGSVGSMSLYSKPAGARIFLDGKPLGFTPASLDKIPTGHHVLRLEHLGTLPWGKVIDVTPTEDTTLHAQMDATPEFKKLEIIMGEVGQEFSRGKVGTAMIKLGQYVGLDWAVFGVVSHQNDEVTLDTWMVSIGSQKRLATRRTNFPDGDFNLQSNIDSFVKNLVHDAMARHEHVVSSDDPLDRDSGTSGWFSQKKKNGKRRSLDVDSADKAHKHTESDDPLDNEDGTEDW